MVDREYVFSILVWVILIACAVGVAFLTVPISSRRRVAYTTLGFSCGIEKYETQNQPRIGSIEREFATSVNQLKSEVS